MQLLRPPGPRRSAETAHGHRGAPAHLAFEINDPAVFVHDLPHKHHPQARAADFGGDTALNACYGSQVLHLKGQGNLFGKGFYQAQAQLFRQQPIFSLRIFGAQG